MTIFLLMISIFPLYSEGKYIVIKTDIKNLKTEQIAVYGSNRDDDWDKHHYIADIFKGDVILENYPEDTLIIEIGQNIPIIIDGIKNIPSDTITISNLKLTHYVPIDSSFTTITRYGHNRSGKYHITKRKYMPLNSKQQVAENISININGAAHAFVLESVPENTFSIYCTPGEKSYSVETYGVRKYYVLKKA